MAKIYAEQVKKAQQIAACVKKNYESVKFHGITLEQIQELEASAQEAARMNAEVEALREEVSRKATLANRKLEEVKRTMMAVKKVVKSNYDPMKWPDFGVMDKR